MGAKYADDTWDFRTADTKMHTNCFYSYPVMMIPPVAGRLSGDTDLIVTTGRYFNWNPPVTLCNPLEGAY
jgi:hypothetical protein